MAIALKPDSFLPHVLDMPEAVMAQKIVRRTLQLLAHGEQRLRLASPFVHSDTLPETFDLEQVAEQPTNLDSKSQSRGVSAWARV